MKFLRRRSRAIDATGPRCKRVLKKLSKVGVSGEALNWFESYTLQIESSSFALAHRYPKFYQLPTECLREQYCHRYCSASI
jgi:hypothetical protein